MAHLARIDLLTCCQLSGNTYLLLRTYGTYGTIGTIHANWIS